MLKFDHTTFQPWHFHLSCLSCCNIATQNMHTQYITITIIRRFRIYSKTFSLFWGILSSGNNNEHYHVQAFHYQRHHRCDHSEETTEITRNCICLYQNPMWHQCILNLTNIDSRSNILKRIIIFGPVHQVRVPFFFIWHQNMTTIHNIFICRQPGWIVWHHTPQFEVSYEAHLRNLSYLYQPWTF